MNKAMAKVQDSHSEMAHARQNDGISVIFDQSSPASSHSRSRSRSSDGNSHSTVSRHDRGRGSHRRRHRSPATSTSSSRSRSRSHPRCHRRSSRCRCDGHYRYGHSRSPSPGKHSRQRRYRSRSRSSCRQSRHRRAVSRLGCRLPRSPSKTNRSHSKSRSPGHSVSLSLEDKRELLKAAQAKAMEILELEKMELHQSVKPILPEQSVFQWESLEPETRVRQAPKKTLSQSHEMEPDDMPRRKMSPKRKIISFSVNNSVAKPTVAAPSCAKVTARVDIYESRKPYGHWVPVKSGQSSSARKHPLATFR